MKLRKINKKGGAILTLIIAVAFFMFGIIIIGLLFPQIAETRSSDNLDCSNMSITDGNKLSCLGVDAVVPAFIIGIILVGGGALVIKLIGN